MKKSIIFIVILAFCACNKREDLPSVEEIHSIHKRIDTIENDSNYYYLKRINKVFKRGTFLPDSLKAENNYLLGRYFKNKNTKDSAAYYFHQATYFVNDSLKNERQATYFLNAFDAYYDEELYGDCFTISKKFKTLLDTVQQHRAMIWALHWEQKVHFKMGKMDKVLENIKQQFEIARMYDENSVPTSLLALAIFKYDYLNDKSAAFKLLDSLLQHEKDLTPLDRLQINERYGIMQYYEGNYPEALRYYLKSCEAAKAENNSASNKNFLANTYNNIAEVYMDLKQYDLAGKYLDSTKRLGFKNLEVRIQKDLLRYELRLTTLGDKNMGHVYAVLDSINNLQDHLYNQKMEGQLLALTKANENEKALLRQTQESQLQSLKFKTLLVFSAVFFGLILIIGGLIAVRRKWVFEKQQLLIQQQLLRSQMNPHFTFNSLYALQVQLKKDSQKASDYLLRFSKLLRGFLENSTQNFVLLEDELQLLKTYLDLQKDLYSRTFTYTILLNNMDDGLPIYIPPALIQPFVENSIKHGFINPDYQGKISITLTKEKKLVKCIIEDNGIGIENPHLQFQEDHNSSTFLIAKFLKKITGKEVTYTYSNLKDKQGVTVTFYIPFKKAKP